MEAQVTMTRHGVILGPLPSIQYLFLLPCLLILTQVTSIVRPFLCTSQVWHLINTDHSLECPLSGCRLCSSGSSEPACRAPPSLPGHREHLCLVPFSCSSSLTAPEQHPDMTCSGCCAKTTCSASWLPTLATSLPWFPIGVAAGKSSVGPVCLSLFPNHPPD